MASLTVEGMTSTGDGDRTAEVVRQDPELEIISLLVRMPCPLLPHNQPERMCQNIYTLGGLGEKTFSKCATPKTTAATITANP